MLYEHVKHILRRPFATKHMPTNRTRYWLYETIFGTYKPGVVDSSCFIEAPAVGPNDHCIPNTLSPDTFTLIYVIRAKGASRGLGKGGGASISFTPCVKYQT